MSTHPAPAPSAPRIRVQPGIVAIVTLFALCGWSLHGVADALGTTPMGQVDYTAIFTVALLGLIAFHEAGHVLGARIFGHRLISVRIGAKFGVTMVGDHTRTSALVSAAAGPVLGTFAATAVLVLAPGGSPMWTAALVAMVENVANVVLFFVKGSDGAKIFTALRHRHQPGWWTTWDGPIAAALPEAALSRRFELKVDTCPILNTQGATA